jgi:uncharacterized protein involved in exopolysaccharide biosynthesis
LFADSKERSDHKSGGTVARKYWRVPVWMLVGAVLGFLASYLFGVQYQATTQVLTRVNNVTFLQSNGSTLQQQGAQVEQLGVSTQIAETEGAVLSNRDVSVAIVKDLSLDQDYVQSPGIFNSIKNAFATTFKFVYSYIVHGTYTKLDNFDQAVQDTQAGLDATQLNQSYVIVVTGKWNTPEKAVAVTNQAADALVTMSEQQFQADTDANLKNLNAQVAQAAQQQQQAAAALASFASSNGLPTASLSGTLTPDVATKLPAPAQANFQALSQTYNTATAAYAQLQAQLQQAQVNQGVKPVQLTRLDTAVAGVYPVSPKRWLYLAIGLVLGAAIGLYLTARALWRNGETLFPRDGSPQLAAAGAAAGRSSGRAEPAADPGVSDSSLERASPAPKAPVRPLEDPARRDPDPGTS